MVFPSLLAQVLSTLVLAVDPAATAARPGVGDPAPALDLPTLEGTQVRRGNLLGQVTVVEFFASWCAPCRSSIADLDGIRAALGTKVKVLVIDVRETPEALRKHLGRRPLPAYAMLALDRHGEVARRWGEDRLPTTFLVDELGIIRHINRGHGPGYRVRLTAWLSAMLAKRR